MMQGGHRHPVDTREILHPKRLREELRSELARNIAYLMGSAPSPTGHWLALSGFNS